MQIDFSIAFPPSLPLSADTSFSNSIPFQCGPPLSLFLSGDDGRGSRYRGSPKVQPVSSPIILTPA